jgi:hypothetical protein
MLRTAAFFICGPIMTLSLAFSQERPSDRIAIDRTISALNDPTRRSSVFAQEGDGLSRYAELRALTPATAFRILGPMESARPVVRISQEPWGEADISLPNARSGIVFIGPDIALSEGTCVYEIAAGITQTKPLLFVLRREDGAWKIASLRILAP